MGSVWTFLLASPLKTVVSAAVLFACINPAAVKAQAQSQIRSENSSETLPLVREAVNESARVTLSGNVHPLTGALPDLGRVEGSFAADRLYLLLKRSPDQEQALKQFLQDAHTPGAAGYHQWLTPEQFGNRFGAADSDITAVTAWLQSHGFSIDKVHPGRTAIEFSGNAAQISAAFHTEIHRYQYLNETRFANNRDPQIPAASPAW